MSQNKLFNIYWNTTSKWIRPHRACSRKRVRERELERGKGHGKGVMMHASKTRTLALLRRTKRKLEAAVSAVHCCFGGFVLSCKPHPCAMKSSHLLGKNLTIFKCSCSCQLASCLYGKGCGFKPFFNAEIYFLCALIAAMTALFSHTNLIMVQWSHYTWRAKA